MLSLFRVGRSLLPIAFLYVDRVYLKSRNPRRGNIANEYTVEKNKSTIEKLSSSPTSPPPKTMAYPNECEAFADARRRRRSSGPSLTQWLTNLFAPRTPKALTEKRERLLPTARSSSRSPSTTARSSLDIESQHSDSSTLNELEREKKAAAAKIDPRTVSDAIIGLSDGLTVPFALTAGLSALGNTKVVIFAGLAELTAGAISMGLGGYLAAKSEEYVDSIILRFTSGSTNRDYRDAGTATLNETRALVSRDPADAASSIRIILEPYDLPSYLTEDLATHLTKSPNLLQFLMHFQHNQPEQEASRALTCAITIACGYFLGKTHPSLTMPYLYAHSY